MRAHAGSATGHNGSCDRQGDREPGRFQAEQRPIPGSEKNHYRCLGGLPILPTARRTRTRRHLWNRSQMPLVCGLLFLVRE
jgi:hypothetical protein